MSGGFLTKIKVYVKLFAGLVQNVPPGILNTESAIRSGTPLPVSLPEGSTLGELVAHLALPADKVRITFVNGRTRKLDHILSDGDEIGIFPPIGGG
jgi:molybdopterin converting factor small subunit